MLYNGSFDLYGKMIFASKNNKTLLFSNEVTK